jgi:hypothetical protein
MVLRIALVATVCISMLLFALGTGARAERLYQSNVDTRVYVAFQVKPEAVQQWLSGPWQVNPVAAGPAKGSNLTLVFVDQHLVQDPEGKPMSGGINRMLALVAPGKHSGTGETAPIVFRLYSASPSYVPGPYKNGLLATVQHERTVKGPGVEPASGRESWSVRDVAGGSLELSFDYQGGVPSRAKAEAKVYSNVEPAFFRIYRIDQGIDVVKSVPNGIDRVQNYRLRVAIPELGALFDGSERLVSIDVRPWYVLQISLP